MTKNRNFTSHTSVTASENHTSDVIILGGGPAGISAALWCGELGLKTVLLDRGERLGGQLLNIYNPVTNYLGISAKNGRLLADRFIECLDGVTSEVYSNAEVVALDTESGTATLDDGRKFSANAIIAATGVRRRKLGVQGEEAFRVRGVLESGAKEKQLVEGKTVVVVGGGDAAIENALILAEFAERVKVVHRRREFAARDEFLLPAQRNPRIEFLTPASVLRIVGTDRVEGVQVVALDCAETRLVPADHVLIRIGVEPNSELFRGKLDLDGHGYLLVNSNCETSAPGIFAAGDIACPNASTIISAAGQGATAAKRAQSYVFPKSQTTNR